MLPAGTDSGSSILLFFPAQGAGSTVSLSDESGAVLASYTPSKSYNSVVVSAEGMRVGGSYTLTAGSYSETVTLSSVIYGSGMGAFGGGPRGPGGPGGGHGGFGGGIGSPGGPGRP